MAIFRHFLRGKAKQDGREVTRDVVLASATLIEGKAVKRAVQRQDWQAELWGYFDTVGELRFAVRWLANAISRCTLFIGQYTEEGAEPTPLDEGFANSLPCQLLEDLYYGQIGQAEMLRRLALHLSIPGESFLVGLDPDPDQGIDVPSWYVCSADEIRVQGQTTSLTLPETGTTIQLKPESSTIIRLWQPHPRYAWKPDSAVRATIPVLRELKGLSDHIGATIDSRLAGAGIFVVPQGVEVARPSGQDPSEVREEGNPEDPFVAALTEAMLTPISDRDDASAVVPIVIKVPDEAAGKFEHIRFDTPFSESVANLRKDALDRFAGGADLPREVISGTGSMNHWGAWQLEESSIKLYVEPMLGAICDALTRQYLWPALRTHGVSDPEQWVIWYNTAELTQRPNRSAEATALYDKGLLSSAATLRENGFGTQDAPTAEERRLWLMERLLLGQRSPEAAAELLSAAETSIEDAYQRTAPATVAAISSPSAPVVDPWWVRTVEQAALRAMELAGNRWRGRQPKPLQHRSELGQYPAWEVHTHIDQAPDAETIGVLTRGALDTARLTLGEDPAVLEAVESYVHHLLATRTSHSRALLTGWLIEHGCTPTGQAA